MPPSERLAARPATVGPRRPAAELEGRRRRRSTPVPARSATAARPRAPAGQDRTPTGRCERRWRVVSKWPVAERAGAELDGDVRVTARSPVPPPPATRRGLGHSVPGAQAGRRFSLNARNPSWASSLVRWRAMTRAVCHLAEPWPRPRTSRTIALAARAAVGPAASRSATAASTAASSAASPSTISWTSPIRARAWHRTGGRRGRGPARASRRSWR